MNKIILLGYMGSGKSTIAKLLAEKTGFPFLDLDKMIETQELLSVREIFEQKGEIYFRKAEHTLLKELVASTDQFVLSLGGGTPCYANNHELLNGEGIISVYLKASVAELYQRLGRNRFRRPLIAAMADDELKEFIAKHLFERSFFYNKASNTIVVDGQSADDVVSEIRSLLV